MNKNIFIAEFFENCQHSIFANIYIFVVVFFSPFIHLYFGGRIVQQSKFGVSALVLSFSMFQSKNDRTTYDTPPDRSTYHIFVGFVLMIPLRKHAHAIYSNISRL